MLPYSPTFSLRNGIGAVPNALMLGLQHNPGPTFINSPQIPLSMSVNNNLPNKDSQWLTLEVCREYQRGMCPRSDLECKYAHPPPYLETSSGRVVCCYDSIKGKCHRIKPPCKYLHPPQHLKDILIQNGKNNLLMKNLQMNIIQQQLSSLTGTSQSRLGLIPVNSKLFSESQISPAPEPIITTSSSNYSYANYYDVSNEGSNAQTGGAIKGECQTTEVPNSSVSLETPVEVTSCVPPSLSSAEVSVGKKRTLTQLYQNCNQNEIFSQNQSDDHVPVKRPVLSESHLTSMLMNRDQQMNSMGYFVNPFMAYQNPLATYLAMNNQAGLQTNGLNMPTILANTPQYPSIAPGLLYSNPQVGNSNLSLMANLQNQQQLAMILNAANLQGNRMFTEFATFK